MIEPWTPDLVEARLLAAGRTLMTLHVAGVWPAQIRSGMPEIVRQYDESYGWDGATPRPAPPSSREIAAMDQALSWVRLIPADRVVFRRIVGARLLCRPAQERPMLSWRAIAARVGASHEAVRVWHGQAIGMIVRRLAEPGFCAASGGVVGVPGWAIGAVIDGARRQAERAEARRERSARQVGGRRERETV